MTAAHSSLAGSFESFREYLLLLARIQIGPKYRAKIDPEGIVNQTLYDADSERAQFRGSADAEIMAWLKRMLSDNVKDAIKFEHREKRDIDQEQRIAVADWDQSCSQLLQITCGLTSPSMKAIKHEREWQLARALSQLLNDQREAIELHHLQGCSLEETADIMGKTCAAVVGLLRRGMKRLRELLQETTA